MLTIREKIIKDYDYGMFKTNPVFEIEDLGQDILIQVDYMDGHDSKVTTRGNLDHVIPYKDDVYHAGYMAAFGSGDKNLLIWSCHLDEWKVFNFDLWESGLELWTASILGGRTSYSDLHLLDIYHIAIFDFIHDVEDQIKDWCVGNFTPVIEPIWDAIKDHWFKIMDVGDDPEPWMIKQYEDMSLKLRDNYQDILDKKDEAILSKLNPVTRRLFD